MSGLTCPICNTVTSFSPAIINGRGIIVKDSSETYTKYGEVKTSAIVPLNYSRRTHAYAILDCEACDTKFVAEKKEYSDEWMAVYPIQHKIAAEEIPEPIKGEFEEANLCFAVGTYRACISICEAALEAMWRQQEKPGLKELRDMEKGWIFLRIKYPAHI